MKLSIAQKIHGFFLLATLFSGVVVYTNTNITTIVLFLSSLTCYCVVIYDIIQTKHSLKRNFPLIARLRWVMESERTKIQQYFIENDTNGTPFNRNQRSDVYRRYRW